jgi:sarcosine oxidase delta subunit
MSIWASVGTADDALASIPVRCQYCGRDDDHEHDALGPFKHTGLPDCADVATATSWHDFIRLAVNGEGLDAEVLLSVKEARLLSRHLNKAIKRIQEAGK